MDWRHTSEGRLAPVRFSPMSIAPLLKARETLEPQIADPDRRVMRLARNNAQVKRFMTVPGVGLNTALCLLATVDDPTRFKRSINVGAFIGLTTRRYPPRDARYVGEAHFLGAGGGCCACSASGLCSLYPVARASQNSPPTNAWSVTLKRDRRNCGAYVYRCAVRLPARKWNVPG